MLKTVIFVTGTDTDIGKTFVSNLLVHKWKANYWKPVQTGMESDEGDTTTIQTNKLTNWDPTLFIPRYSLQKPLSPYQAMEFEPDTQIELNDFILPKFLDNTPLVVEGAGGVFVPITKKLEITTDLIKHLIKTNPEKNIKIVIVARSGLGTLNHTLLTQEHLQNAGLKNHLLGCIVNGTPNKGNVDCLRKFGVNVIAEIPKCVTNEETNIALEGIPSLESLL